MTLDYDKYSPFLNDLALTLEQKNEIIDTVWGLMESHADQAFGVHPVQNCGYLETTDSQFKIPEVDSKGTSTTYQFNSMV